MPPKSKKGVKMGLQEFFETTGTTKSSWADETENLPTEPSSRYDDGGDDHRSGGGIGGAFSRMGYGDRDGGSGGSRYGSSDRPSRGPAEIPDRGPYKAYVGNLSYDADETAVRDFFSGCQVVSFYAVKDRETQQPKGFGYVEFGDRESLVKALALSGQNLLDRAVRIDVSESKSSDRQQRDRGGFGSDEPRDEARATGNWRTAAAVLPPPPEPSRGGFGGDRYGDRDGGSRSGGFADRYQDRGASDRGSDREPPKVDPNAGRSDAGRWGRGEAVPAAERTERTDRPERFERTERVERVERASAAPAERPRLNLKPRAAPVEKVEPKTAAEGAAVHEEKATDKPAAHKDDHDDHHKANPFGSARPVDTAAREAAMEKRLAEMRLKAAASKEEGAAAPGGEEKPAGGDGHAHGPRDGPREHHGEERRFSRDGERGGDRGGRYEDRGGERAGQYSHFGGGRRDREAHHEGGGDRGYDRRDDRGDRGDRGSFGGPRRDDRDGGRDSRGGDRGGYNRSSYRDDDRRGGSGYNRGGSFNRDDRRGAPPSGPRSAPPPRDAEPSGTRTAPPVAPVSNKYAGLEQDE